MQAQSYVGRTAAIVIICVSSTITGQLPVLVLMDTCWLAMEATVLVCV